MLQWRMHAFMLPMLAPACVPFHARHACNPLPAQEGSDCWSCAYEGCTQWSGPGGQLVSSASEACPDDTSQPPACTACATGYYLVSRERGAFPE